jgi:hypothetical protein
MSFIKASATLGSGSEMIKRFISEKLTISVFKKRKYVSQANLSKSSDLSNFSPYEGKMSKTLLSK